MSSYTTLRYYNLNKSPIPIENLLVHGPALTSNAKYIVPDSEVYRQTTTPMFLYPGNTGFLPPPISQDLGPKSIKAWHSDPHILHAHNIKQPKSGCYSCS